MDEEKEQFRNVWGKGHSHKRQHEFSDILASCKDIENLLAHEFFHELINEITQQVKDRFMHLISRLIVTVEFRRNQINEFYQFVKLISEKFEDKKHEILTQYPPEKVGVIYLMKSQVREIVMNMYIYMEENPQFEIVVFIVSAMTDLDEYNMYCFQKGLKDKKLVLIVCSHHNFENSPEESNEQFQKMHYSFYNPKDLFCQYLYRCMNSPIIKPYLPPQVLTLITDMNYYSISYHQSCRRFMYCLERSLMVYRKERIFVEFDSLIALIDRAVGKEINIYAGRRATSKEKILKIVITEKQSFHISERDLILEIAMRTSSPDNCLLEEEHIILCIKESIKKKLKADDRYRKYASYLDDNSAVELNQEKGGRRKKSRFEQLGIDISKNMPPKNKLESQITKIIKDATALIRQQASFIKWDDLKYQLRIKPQIPMLIKQAWSDDKETAELVDQVTQNYCAPVTAYLKLFEDEDLGKGIYLLKCLQYAGLIDISKKLIKPNVYTQYFDKATFSLKQQK